MAAHSAAPQRLLAAIVALAIALAFAPAQAAGPAAQPPPEAPSGAQAFAHVQHLAGVIGPRPAGTPAERQAADYLAATLRQHGYPVEMHAFPFPFFEARRVDVQVAGATPRTLAAQALFLSAATPPGGVEADVVVAGLGRPEDYEGRRADGAIVLVERGMITFREKVTHAAARGAAAVVVYNNQPGLVAGTLGQRSEIPAVIVSQDDGRALVEAVQRGGLRLRLVVDAVHETRTAANVVATRRGATQPDAIVVVGAHFDSVPGSPGANDNASGVAAVLEAARVLADAPLARTVQFVLFSAEELGLHGSAAFVSERRAGVMAMVNLDMVGWGDRLMAGNGSGRDDGPVGAALEVGRRLGIEITRFRATASDHTSFERAGVPAVFLHRGVDPHHHRPTDVPANIAPGHLEEAGRLVAALVQELAGARSARRPPARVRG
ncbi:MAG: M28 family metallopeptidase [Armatimonadota bacterium]|nr:M28 family metallopeptidase [Armatimonadota bacterium]